MEDFENDGDGGEEITSDASNSGITQENEDAIQAALDRFHGADEGESTESTRREVTRRKAGEAEQRQELREEGLEGEEPEVDEEAVAKGEEEAPAIQSKEETEEEVTDETPKEADAPKIDPRLRYFAAATLGWSDEKIDKLVKADPELASETISSLADSYSNLSRQLLTAPQPQAGTQQVQPPAQPANPTSKLDQIYAGINEFAEANGEELADFMKALKSELIDPWRAEQAKIEVRQQELSKTEARTTFGTLSTKFAGLYGKQGESRLPEQQKAVNDLAEVADQLRAGAKARGQELSIADAINRAHLLVSHEYRGQQVRKAIKEQVQTRAKGLTAKPTNRQNPITSSNKSREAASEALARKAAELGIAGFDE